MICCDKLDEKEIQERERLGIAAIASAYICKWGGAYEEHSDFIIEFTDNDIINICKAVNKILYPNFQVKDKYHAYYTKEINGPRGDTVSVIESFFYYLNTTTSKKYVETQTYFLDTDFSDEEDINDRDYPQGYMGFVENPNKPEIENKLEDRKKLGCLLNVFRNDVCQENIKEYLDDVDNGKGTYYQTYVVHFDTEELYHVLCNVCMPAFASRIFDTAFNMFCDEDFEYYNDFCDTGLCDMVFYTFSKREDDNTMAPTDFTYSLPEGLSIFNETWLGYYGEHFDYLHNDFAKATHDLLEYDFENYQEAFYNNNLE